MSTDEKIQMDTDYFYKDLAYKIMANRAIIYLVLICVKITKASL